MICTFFKEKKKLFSLTFEFEFKDLPLILKILLSKLNEEEGFGYENIILLEKKDIIKRREFELADSFVEIVDEKYLSFYFPKITKRWIQIPISKLQDKDVRKIEGTINKIFFLEEIKEI